MILWLIIIVKNINWVYYNNKTNKDNSRTVNIYMNAYLYIYIYVQTFLTHIKNLYFFNLFQFQSQEIK